MLFFQIISQQKKLISVKTTSQHPPISQTKRYTHKFGVKEDFESTSSSNTKRLLYNKQMLTLFRVKAQEDYPKLVLSLSLKATKLL